MCNTIIAISTPPVNGAIGIVRISGENSKVILEKYFFPVGNIKIIPRFATYGNLIDNDEKLDKCLALYFNKPHSYTGEDLVEFHLHGSFFLLENFKSRVILSNLAREAEPGEFTRRAFENGKISLTDSEALNMLIKSETEMQIKISNLASSGVLSKTAKKIKNSLLTLNAKIEAKIEYPEETEETEINNEYISNVREIINIIENLLSGYFKVKKVFEGIKVVIAGLPNSGKSSLLNAIAGYDRVIVTGIPGTTTDTVEVPLNIDGFKVVFIDTAGLRFSKNIIEKEGIERAKNEIIKSDLVINLIDGITLENVNNFEFLKQKDKVIDVYSKVDLLTEKRKNKIYISSKTGEGIQRLKDLLVKKYREIDSSNGIIITSRQENALSKTLDSLKCVLEGFKDEVYLEVISSQLNDGIFNLSTLIGTVTNDDILDKMFSDFCLGK